MCQVLGVSYLISSQLPHKAGIFVLHSTTEETEAQREVHNSQS